MKRKHVIISLSVLLAVMAALAFAVLFAVPYAISSARYKQAEESLESGDYQKALAAFEETEGFRDSKEKIEKLKKYLIPYEQAENLLAEGDFTRAVEAFFELGDYGDSPKRVLEAKYALAQKQLQNDEYEEAIVAFRELGDYGDSQEKALEATYALAQKHFQNAEYAAALAIFRELGEKKYSNSEERAEDTIRYIRYNAALDLLEKQNFIKAYEEFDSLGDFLDCSDKLIEVDKAYWQHTDAQNAMEAYSLYLKFPGANHKTEAEAAYERLFALEQTEKAERAFENASAKNTVKALNFFAAAWENSPYAADFLERAESRIKELQNDGSFSSAILENANSATKADIETFLADYPGHRDEAKIRGLVEGDIFTLTGSGVIELYITGDSIDYTTVRLKNKSIRNMTVIIPTGAYFAANSAGVQNMAVRETKTVSIRANDSTSVSIPTACMNIDKAVPDFNDGFKLSVLGTGSKLERVMFLLEQNNASYSVAQAAVWIVTDNPNEHDLLNTLVYSDGARAISSGDLARAREIVAEAG
ncbi:MAG: hypothetical protein FWD23_04015 [Oscillospiraceae bacterium]|nr:hypothetical protein [Oscillospiraceae bacterium]